MKPSLKIGILCDLSPNSGLGHYSRMKCLSFSLEKLNIEPIYIFESSHKKFLKNLKINRKIIYYNKKNKPIENINTLSKKNKISSIIVDSYKVNYSWEKELKKHGFFLIAIDDHLKKHCADIVFTNKPKRESKFLNTKDQTWFMGPEYTIVSDFKRRNNDYKKIKNILLHAGGSGLFNLIKDFTLSTIRLVNKYDVTVSILCPNKKSEEIIKKIILKTKIKKKLNIIPYTENLLSEMKNYNIIAGPSGTSTFETILAGSFPFTVQLKNDGRDSMRSWHNIGHLMHLSFKDKKNISVLDSSWELIFEGKKNLSKILNSHSRMIDGKGAQRVAKIIMEHSSAKTNVKNYKKIINSNDFKMNSYSCTFYDMHHFLELRNQKNVRLASTYPNHIITWPEHVSWWLKTNIRKFSIEVNNKIIGYHWIKLNSDHVGEYITSGWFLEDKIANKLKTANQILKFQSDSVKKYYKDVDWIIIMRNNNVFVEKMNLDVGFKSAARLSIKRAIDIFNIKEDDYKIMEMKL